MSEKYAEIYLWGVSKQTASEKIDKMEEEFIFTISFSVHWQMAKLSPSLLLARQLNALSVFCHLQLNLCRHFSDNA